MFIYSVAFPHPTLTPEDLEAFLVKELNAEDVEALADGDPRRLQARFRHLWLETETVASQIRRRFGAGDVDVERSGEASVGADELPPEPETGPLVLHGRILELLDSAGSMRLDDLSRIMTRRSVREIRNALRVLVLAGKVRELGDGWFTVADGTQGAPAPAPVSASPAPVRPGDHLPAESLAGRLRDLAERVPVLSRSRISAWAEGLTEGLTEEVAGEVTEHELGRALARLVQLKVLRRVDRDLYVAMDQPDPTPADLAALGLAEAKPQGVSPPPPPDPGQAAVAQALAGGAIVQPESLEALFPTPAAQVRAALAGLVRAGRARRVGRHVFVAADRPEPTREELRAARPRPERTPAAPASGSAGDLVLQALQDGRILRYSDLIKDRSKTPAAFSLALKSLVERGAVRRLAHGLYIGAEHPDPEPQVLAALLEKPKAPGRTRSKPEPKAPAPRRGLPGLILARLEEASPLTVETVQGFQPGTTAGSARQALRALVKDGVLRRASRGVYLAAGQSEPGREMPRSDLDRTLLKALGDRMLTTAEIGAALERPARGRNGLLRVLGRLAAAGLVEGLGATRSRRWTITVKGRGAVDAAEDRSRSPAPTGPKKFKPGRLPRIILDRLAEVVELTRAEAIALAPGTTPSYASVALSELMKAGLIRRLGPGRYAAVTADEALTPSPEPASRESEFSGSDFRDSERPEAVPEEATSRPAAREDAPAPDPAAARVEAPLGPLSRAILEFLDGSDPLTVAEIRARMLRLQSSRGSASAMLTRLVAQGLLERSRSEGRRDSRFRLSEKGRLALALAAHASQDA